MKKGVIAFLLSFAIFSCGKNQNTNVKTDLEKRNLRGAVKSFTISQTYRNKSINKYPESFFIKSYWFNKDGFITQKLLVDEYDSVITRYFYNKAYLLDSSYQYQFSSYVDNDTSRTFLKNSNNKFIYNNGNQRFKVSYYKYDSLDRIIGIKSYDNKNNLVRTEKIQHVENYNYKLHTYSFPKRGYKNECINKFNEEGQMISSNYKYDLRLYYQYFYDDNGLPNGFKCFYGSPIEKPIRKIDSVNYIFDDINNWINRIEYNDGEIAFKFKRDIDYR